MVTGLFPIQRIEGQLERTLVIDGDKPRRFRMSLQQYPVFWWRSTGLFLPCVRSSVIWENKIHQGNTDSLA
jgi:hypothetical protein